MEILCYLLDEQLRFARVFLLEFTGNTISSCIYHMYLAFVVDAADCNFVGSQGSMDLGSWVCYNFEGRCMICGSTTTLSEI